MKFKWKIVALASLLLIPSLYGMQQPAQQSAPQQQRSTTPPAKPTSNEFSVGSYMASLAQNALTTKVMYGNEAVIPSLSRFVIVDFASRALSKVLGFAKQSQKNTVETLVGHATSGVMGYCAQPQGNGNKSKPSFLTYLVKVMWPSFVRSMTIDFAHTAFTHTTGADYPSFLRNTWPIAFVLPYCSMFAKELIWGTAYHALTNVQKR